MRPTTPGAGGAPAVVVNRGPVPSAGPLPRHLERFGTGGEPEALAPRAGPVPRRRSVAVAVDFAGGGYHLGAGATPGAVAVIAREGPGRLVVTLAEPWPVFARVVATPELPNRGGARVVVDVVPLDARRLRVTRREGRPFASWTPTDGSIRLTIHELGPRARG